MRPERVFLICSVDFSSLRRVEGRGLTGLGIDSGLDACLRRVEGGVIGVEADSTDENSQPKSTFKISRSTSENLSSPTANCFKKFRFRVQVYST